MLGAAWQRLGSSERIRKQPRNPANAAPVAEQMQKDMFRRTADGNPLGTKLILKLVAEYTGQQDKLEEGADGKLQVKANNTLVVTDNILGFLCFKVSSGLPAMHHQLQYGQVGGAGLRGERAGTATAQHHATFCRARALHSLRESGRQLGITESRKVSCACAPRVAGPAPGQSRPVRQNDGQGRRETDEGCRPEVQRGGRQPC